MEVGEKKILLWHQGALGDLLLAGPALMALRRRFPDARMAAVGHPERWRLLARALDLKEIWDGSEALWAWLHREDGPLPWELRCRLEGVALAVVFRPRPPETLDRRLQEAGVARVVWVPSAPGEEREPLGRRQLRYLSSLVGENGLSPFRLPMAPNGPWPPELPQEGEFLVAAPGSGCPAKNWPLAHYYEIMRALSWEHPFPVVWVTGPAEAAWQPYLAGLARAQGHYLLHERSLPEVAQVLARARLYLGNDSGLTHLAAAAGARQVLALFGPTDPVVWAPFGDSVTVAQSPSGDLTRLSLSRVLQTARQLLAAQ